jgi:hypothetical protein
MALEAVVFPQAHPPCAAKALSMGALSAPPACSIDIVDEFEDKGGVVPQEKALHGVVGAAAARDAACSVAAEEQFVSTPPALAPESGGNNKASSAPASRTRRRKRPKDQEEMESQRRSHIAVERNRRRQMNEYLALLRSVMPPSYAQRVRTYVSHRIILVV